MVKFEITADIDAHDTGFVVHLIGLINALETDEQLGSWIPGKSNYYGCTLQIEELAQRCNVTFSKIFYDKLHKAQNWAAVFDTYNGIIALYNLKVDLHSIMFLALRSMNTPLFQFKVLEASLYAEHK